MSTNVNKIIENAVGQVRSILMQAVEQVDESARADLIEQFNQSVGGKKITTVKAKAVAKTAKTKTKKVAAKTKVKVKRVVSDETRKKLAANLKKARAAKAAKTEAPASKKNGRTAKKK